MSTSSLPITSLRTLFESLATRTWERIREGHRLRVPQGEVALTDYLLLELALARHPGLAIIKTPIDREPDQGTDWEWLIGSFAVGWLRYAVQAKRVDFPSGRYPALVHTVAGQSQVDVLLAYAKTNDAIPLYCFYNHSNITPLDPYWHCDLPLDATQLGCTVAPASLVKPKIAQRGAKNFRNIHAEKETRPWRCLVGCAEILSTYAAGKGNRAPFPLLPGDDTAFVHPALPPPLQEALNAASDRGAIVTLSERDFDSRFFSGDRIALPRYVVVVDVGLSPANVPPAEAKPLLLPEASDKDVIGLPRTTSRRPELKKIRSGL